MLAPPQAKPNPKVASPAAKSAQRRAPLATHRPSPAPPQAVGAYGQTEAVGSAMPIPSVWSTKANVFGPPPQHDGTTLPARVPPRLVLTDAKDPAEIEARWMARRLMRKAGPAGRGAAAPLGPEAPALVHAALRSPGYPLAAQDRSFFEARFGEDLGHVRIHMDAVAGESARAIGALAYTVGSRIAFAHGLYQPLTGPGRELLAHELAHVVQHGDSTDAACTVRRQETEGGGKPLEERATREESKAIIRDLERVVPGAAGGVGDFVHAFQILNGLAMFAMLDTLDELKTLGEFALLKDNIGSAEGVNRPRIEVAMAAVHDHGSVTFEAFAAGQGDAFSSLTPGQQEDIQRFFAKPAAPQAAPEAGPPAQKPISALSAGEKLSLALDFARSKRDESWNRAIEDLKSPRSILTMAFIAGAFIAAQAVPVTWIADAALLAGLTIAGFFLGVSAATLVIDIAKFFAAINAQTEDDLRASGQALADAVSIFGVFAITGALSEGIGAGIKGASTTPLDPPPTGFADAYAPGAGIIRVPKDMVPADAPTFPTNLQMSGGKPGGGGEPGGAPKGRETALPEGAGGATETKPAEAKPAGGAPVGGTVVEQVVSDPNVNVGSQLPWRGKGPEPSWANPKSQKAYDHIESTHGPSLKPDVFRGRLASPKAAARQGQWYKAADWVTAEQATPKHPGKYVIDFGRSIGRVYNADGTVTENVTRAFVQRNPDGSLNSAYPVDNNFKLQ